MLAPDDLHLVGVTIYEWFEREEWVLAPDDLHPLLLIMVARTALNHYKRFPLTSRQKSIDFYGKSYRHPWMSGSSASFTPSVSLLAQEISTCLRSIFNRSPLTNCQTSIDFYWKSYRNPWMSSRFPSGPLPPSPPSGLPCEA